MGDNDGDDEILGSSLEALLGCNDTEGLLEVYNDGDCDGIVDVDGSCVLVVVGLPLNVGADEILGSSLEIRLGCEDIEGLLEVYIDGDCDGIVDIDGSCVLAVVGFDDSDGCPDGSKLSVGA